MSEKTQPQKLLEAILPQPKPAPYNNYSCPECEADVPVGLPAAKYATCPECKAKLEVHPDADFENGMWHDRTELSVIDEEREHMKKMLRFMQNEH